MDLFVSFEQGWVTPGLATLSGLTGSQGTHYSLGYSVGPFREGFTTNTSKFIMKYTHNYYKKVNIYYEIFKSYYFVSRCA